MSVDKLKKAIALWGPIMTGGYGQSEAMTGISNLRPDEHMVAGQLASDERLSSVGRPNPLIRVAIMDDTGATKEDLKLPPDDTLARQIQDDFDAGKNLVVTVLMSMGEEMINAVKEGA